MINIGNIGILTNTDQKLCEVIAIKGQTVFSVLLDDRRIVRTCEAGDFWVLLDKLP